MKPLLAICIPTYNRDYMLDKMLAQLCPICKDLEVPIYISDNCSPDGTQKIINKYEKEYTLINYFQKENIGPDKNFEYLLKHVSAQYKWLVSDSSVIIKEELAALLDILQHEFYDFVVTGWKNRTEYLPERKLYTDANNLLEELGWHMTQVSSLIYNDDVIPDLNFVRYYGTNFLQTGIIFEHIAYQSSFKCLLFNALKPQGLNMPKRNHWKHLALEYFCKRWLVFVMSLPCSYKYEAKRQCIMAHGIRSRLFSRKQLLLFKANNTLNISKYIQYKDFIPFTIYHRWFCLFLCFIPQLILKPLYKTYKLFKGSKKSI